MELHGKLGDVFTTRLTYFSNGESAFLFFNGYKAPPLDEHVRLTRWLKFANKLSYVLANLSKPSHILEALSCPSRASGDLEFLEAKYYTLLDERLLTWTWFEEKKLSGQGKNIEHPDEIPVGKYIEAIEFDVVKHSHFGRYPEYYVSKFRLI